MLYFKARKVQIITKTKTAESGHYTSLYKECLCYWLSVA